MPVELQYNGQTYEIEAPPGTTPDQYLTYARQAERTHLKEAATAPLQDTSGYWTGAKEGMAGGAKGFAKGMLESPVSLVSGLAQTVRHPIDTLTEIPAALKSIPAAVMRAGSDPEGWGRQIGNLTGQQMIMMAAPTAIPAAAKAVPSALRATARATGTTIKTMGEHPFMTGLGSEMLGGGHAGAFGAIAVSPLLKTLGSKLQQLGATGAEAAPEAATGAAGATAGLGTAGPSEGVLVERLFQDLARKPILSPAEAAQLAQLKKVIGGRAADVGLGYASGGIKGLPK